jgi:hypothetical protein
MMRAKKSKGKAKRSTISILLRKTMIVVAFNLKLYEMLNIAHASPAQRSRC